LAATRKRQQHRDGLCFVRYQSSLNHFRLIFCGRYSKRLEQQRFESRVEKEIENSKPEARQSVLLQCLNLDDSSRPIAIDWLAYDKPFEEAGSMLPLLRHEVDLWLKTVWGLLKPYEDRMTLDAFKCVSCPFVAILFVRFQSAPRAGTTRCRMRSSGRSGCRSAKRAA
jgi:hypothetical protein